MFRFLFLLLLLGAIAGYFTKPTEAQHRAAADAALRQVLGHATSNLDLGGMLQTGIAQLSESGAYTDYYVASEYTVEVNHHVLAECWGAFGQVRCIPKVGASNGAAAPA
jgi:hypothetical protein